MICPNCKSEYRVGFTKCADCNIELVEEIQENLEAENTKEIHPEDPVEILQVMNHGDIAFIKSLLESENIIYLFYGESAMGKTWGASKARLFIDKADTKKATELLVAAGML